eukprot:scaffold318114_cov23-Prasinocladus_malaysianus.AAC.1
MQARSGGSVPPYLMQELKEATQDMDGAALELCESFGITEASKINKKIAVTLQELPTRKGSVHRLGQIIARITLFLLKRTIYPAGIPNINAITMTKALSLATTLR